LGELLLSFHYGTLQMPPTSTATALTFPALLQGTEQTGEVDDNGALLD
jgi:hypothetical protein